MEQKEGEIPPSHLSVQVHKKAALLFHTHSPQPKKKKEMEPDSAAKKNIWGARRRGKFPLPYISLSRQKESNYSALRRVNTAEQ